MKLLNAALLVSIFSSIFLISCRKENTDEELLPPITQNGANTFGCLINGKIYTQKGFLQNTPNFQLSVDTNFNDGSFGAITFRKTDNTIVDFTIGSDSMKGVGLYPAKFNGRIGFTYSQTISGNNQCFTISKDVVGVRGFIRMTKYDLVNGIFSGEFEFHFSNPACGIGDSIHITNGRFDKKL